MDTVKISELVAATVVEAGNYLIINQAGTTKKADASIIVDLTTKAAWMIRNWAMAEAFAVDNITFKASGNINTADLVWPDGTVGTISDVAESNRLITSIKYNYSDKWVKLDITYHAGEIESTNWTTNGF